MEREKPVLEFVADDMVCVTWANVILVYVRRQPTRATIERTVDVGNRLFRKFPGGYNSVTVATPQAKMPDAETRKFSADLMKQTEPRMLSMATVLEGEGFWAATARTFMAGLAFISGVKYPTYISASPEDAGRFLVPHFKGAPGADAAGFVAAVQFAKDAASNARAAAA